MTALEETFSYKGYEFKITEHSDYFTGESLANTGLMPEPFSVCKPTGSARPHCKQVLWFEASEYFAIGAKDQVKQRAKDSLKTKLKQQVDKHLKDEHKPA